MWQRTASSSRSRDGNKAQTLRNWVNVADNSSPGLGVSALLAVVFAESCWQPFPSALVHSSCRRVTNQAGSPLPVRPASTLVEGSSWASSLPRRLGRF